MKYYIHVLSIEAISPKHIRAFLRDDLAGGKAQKRLSLKGRNILEETEVLKKLTQIPSTTDLIKAVVLKIYDDILINKRKKPISDLKNIIAATA